MKRYTEYGKGELASLTEEQVTVLIDIEIAEAGIKPVTQPKELSLSDAGITATEIFFQVSGGGYRDEILVKTEEQARQIAAIPAFKKAYDYNMGDKYSWAETNTITVSQVSLYKQEDVRRIAPLLQENKTKREKYNKENQEYQKYCDATANCRNSVWSAVSDDKEWVKETELAKRTWEKHLKLADGDRKVAERFFRNAYQGEDELIEVVLGIKSGNAEVQ
jgi:hypothetical protein